jgi:DNA-binding CsgD family transcriptional regulator
VSRFEDDFLKGYDKHRKFFDDFAKHAYYLLGDIAQCGIIDFSKSGNISIAANRKDIGEDAIANKIWEHQNLWCHKDGLLKGEFDAGSYWHYEKLGLFKSKFDLFHFSYRENVDPDTQRLMFFCSHDPRLYGALINNFALVKKMLKHFFSDTHDIAMKCQEHMVDISKIAPNYFVKFNPKKDTDLDRVNTLLQDFQLLGNERISSREWQCAMLYARGKSARQTGDILGISRRTVEGHFESLKSKLGVKNKSEILDKLV